MSTWNSQLKNKNTSIFHIIEVSVFVLLIAFMLCTNAIEEDEYKTKVSFSNKFGPTTIQLSVAPSANIFKIRNCKIAEYAKSKNAFRISVVLPQESEIAILDLGDGKPFKMMNEIFEMYEKGITPSKDTLLVDKVLKNC